MLLSGEGLSSREPRGLAGFHHPCPAHSLDIKEQDTQIGRTLPATGGVRGAVCLFRSAYVTALFQPFASPQPFVGLVTWRFPGRSLKGDPPPPTSHSHQPRTETSSIQPHADPLGTRGTRRQAGW